MIEGLKLDFSTDELRDHLLARANYHDEKRTWYEGQVASLRSGGLSLTHASNDPISSLERSRDEHGNKAAFFTVLFEHLVPGETYRLSEQDLIRIELYSRMW